jgi:hypothetical protein
MHITEKGQVTISLKIRDRYGFLPHIQFIPSKEFVADYY